MRHQRTSHLEPIPVANGTEVLQMMSKGEKSIKCVNAGLGFEDARAIADSLRGEGGGSECEELFLGANKFGSDGANVFGEVLRAKTSLRKLDLAANRIDAKGADKLAEALKGNMTMLEFLNLSYNSLHDEGTAKLADALKQNKAPYLQDLNLGMNEIGPAGCRAVAMVLKERSSDLQVLNMSRNVCKAAGGYDIAEALKENNTLKKLNLAGSIQCPNIESSGAKAIAEALKMPSPLRELQNDATHEDNFALQHLVLSYNCIDDDAGKAIAKALESNHSIKSLLLRGNLMTLDAGKAFTEMLCRNKSLHTLDLSENQLNNSAGLGFARALTVNRGLRGLNISANPLGGKFVTEEDKKDRVGKEFAAVVQHNKCLERIHLGGCGLEDSELKLINGAVDAHGVFLKFDLD